MSVLAYVGPKYRGLVRARQSGLRQGIICRSLPHGARHFMRVAISMMLGPFVTDGRLTLK